MHVCLLLGVLMAQVTEPRFPGCPRHGAPSAYTAGYCSLEEEAQADREFGPRPRTVCVRECVLRVVATVCLLCCLIRNIFWLKVAT